MTIRFGDFTTLYCFGIISVAYFVSVISKSFPQPPTPQYIPSKAGPFGYFLLGEARRAQIGGAAALEPIKSPKSN